MTHEMQHSFCFEAGHACLDIPGACSFPHGHSFLLIVRCKPQELQDERDASMKIVQQMVDTSFNHKWLNDTLHESNPGLDYITNWIFNYLKDKIPTLIEIQLYTSPKHSVSIKI